MNVIILINVDGNGSNDLMWLKLNPLTNKTKTNCSQIKSLIVNFDINHKKQYK